MSVFRAAPIFVLAGAACQPSEHGLHHQSASPELVPTTDLGDGGAYAVFVEPKPPSTQARPPRKPPQESVPSTSAPAHPWPAEPIVREEHFWLGHGPTPAVDYLFVIDDSVSMKAILGRFRRGMRHLGRPGVFPSRSRLAVLNTTPADPTDPTRAHPMVRQNTEADLLPGFQHLVDAEGIAMYVADAPEKMQKRFSMPGCDAWFGPNDRNADQVSCLRAHSQLGLVPGRAEAGLVALAQWMEAMEAADQPQFRAGAAVNVIFVSDTHDPGLHASLLDQPLGQDLLSLQPSVEDLLDRLNVPVASFRLHAIAPESECGEKWTDPSYHRAAKASGGVTADVCTLRDYRPVIEQIVHTGARTDQSVVRLGRLPSEIESVELNHKPVGWWSDGQAVGLDQPGQQGELVVRYRVDSEGSPAR